MITLHRKNSLFAWALGLALAACSQLPKEAYYTHGQAENLVSTSSEVVNLKIGSPADVEEITTWVAREKPTRAELACARSDELCGEARRVLDQFGVPVKTKQAFGNKVALVYERVRVRNCENRYIDNPVDPYNLDYPTYGCTVSLNMVQMVTDKREFTNPELAGFPDARKTVQATGFYYTPSTYTPPITDSTLPPIVTQQSIQTQGLTGGTGGR